MAIAAIQTSYAGHRFRSRLEARWAVFFDALKINWEYEPQGYIVGPSDHQLSYLPDFHLPDINLWIEVKGQATDRDLGVLQYAAAPEELGGLPGNDKGRHSANVVVLGNIPPVESRMALHFAFGCSEAGALRVPLVAWGPTRPFVVLDDWPWPLKPEALTRSMTMEVGLGYTKVWDAYTAARTARFEHGESGAPRIQPESIRTW